MVVPLPAPRPAPLPSMQDLSAVSRAVAAEVTLGAAVVRIQREVCRMLRASEALVVVIDWARLELTTLHGAVTNDATRLLLTQVAGSGRRAILGNALLEPIGATPARTVLAIRRPLGRTFAPPEIAMIGVLAGGFAPVLERLHPRR